jgi:hypothetical protein
MPRCKACCDPRRDQIDSQIIAGTPLRTLVASTGISLGALSRHKSHIKQMVGLALNERTQEEKEEHGSALLQRVLRLTDEAEKILAAASAKKDFRSANGALGAAAKLLDLCGRLSGELQGPNTPGLHLTLNSTRINVTHYNDDAELASLIAEATDNFNPAEIARLKRIAEGQNILPACNDLATLR